MTEKENVKTEKRRMPLRALYAIIAVIGIVVLIVLIVNMIRINRTYSALDQAVEDYTSAYADATDLTAASDYLTEQVREFSVTADRIYLDRFFEEVKQTRRRDKAVENIRSELKTIDADSVQYLEKSLSLSNELIQTEYYAFRLGAESAGYKLSELPEEIQSVQLSAEDAALSAQDKLAKARDLVYSREYQETKDEIHNNADMCTSRLIESVRQRELSNSKQLRSLIILQYVLIGVVIVVILLYLLFTEKLIINPIENFVKSIRGNERMPRNGLQEFSFLADSYNEMFDKTQEDQQKLSYEATHDALTNVYNRAAYEDIMARHDSDEICFIIVDIDKFKQFNDQFGHAMGDKVLQRVSGVLKRSFRSEDYICRIGGDEFVVIMVNVTSELKNLVQTKLERIARILNTEKDDVPAITLSIGVAFSDRQDPQGSIYEDADRALYNAKEKGKNTFAFY